MRVLKHGRAAWRGRSRKGRAGQSRLVVAAVFSAALLALMQAPAGAATNPYAGTGYDASSASAQCTASTYPPGFAIIGLGTGRPFTTNACLATEWGVALNSGATPGPSLYFNTGYAGAYVKQITAGCKSAVGHAPIPPGTSGHQKSTEQQAWEIGCSEADYAAARAPGLPAMWWADVETSNSWSVNTLYNDLAIDGIAYETSVLSPATGVGVYSTPAMWNQIAGAGFVPTPTITADWQPTSSCPAPGSSGFSNSPVWLIQNGSVSPNGVSFSTDQAC
jgi:hypothetical protein